MFNKFRAGSAFSRKRPAAAPAAPTQQRAVAAPATNSMFNKFRAGSAFSRKRPAAAPASPVQQRADVRAMAASTPKGSPVAPAQGLKLTPAQVAKMQREQSGLKAIGRQATPDEVAALKKQSPNVASYNEGLAKAFQQFNTQPKTPVVAAPTTPQPRMTNDIVSQNDAKGNAMMKQASRAADERFLEKKAQKAKATPAPAVQVPTPPPFRKGGAVKKTGYAKGGAVMCGASMPPAQKRKK